jgi:acyl carrier protein
LYSSEIATLLEQVRSIIADQLSIPRDMITAYAVLERDLNIRGLDFARICIALEEVYDIEIDEAREFRTVFDVATYLNARGLSSDYARQPARLLGCGDPRHSERLDPVQWCLRADRNLPRERMQWVTLPCPWLTWRRTSNSGR